MRKIVFGVILSFTSVLLGWLVLSSVTKLDEIERRDEIVSSIPSLTITELSGDLFQLKEAISLEPLILILFNSECEHCQNEASSIASNLDHFNDIQIVFLSAEEMGTIRSFGISYNLLDRDNIHIGKVDYLELSATFMSFSYPNIFIYGKDGILLKEFKGETKIEAILKVLRAG